MAQSVNRSTGDQPRVGPTQSVNRPLGAIDNNGILGESELVSEFISRPISEVLVSFSLWVLCLYIEGCCNLLYNLKSNLVLRVSGLVCLREFYGKLRSFSIWISFDQFESLNQLTLLIE